VLNSINYKIMNVFPVLQAKLSKIVMIIHAKMVLAQIVPLDMNFKEDNVLPVVHQKYHYNAMEFHLVFQLFQIVIATIVMIIHVQYVKMVIS